ncbi:hypothetical protein ACIP29_04470 [Streptomyces coelicoflavus]
MFVDDGQGSKPPVHHRLFRFGHRGRRRGEGPAAAVDIAKVVH